MAAVDIDGDEVVRLIYELHLIGFDYRLAVSSKKFGAFIPSNRLSQARNWIFSRCHLAGSNYDGMDLEDINFSGSNLSEASFERATLTRCIFSISELEGSKWNSATLRDCTFDTAKNVPVNHILAHAEVDAATKAQISFVNT